jgi:hypothetical protein
LAFLPYEAWVEADAILRTLLRLTITHKGMLRWTTSSQVSHLLVNSDTWATWKQMAISTLLSLDLAGGIILFRFQAFAFAAPLLAMWLISPGIAAWIGKPNQKRQEKLDDSQLRAFHRLARKTWLFFEQFIGPEDHWLPPDHYQEAPLGIVAHHTSPTNIGLPAIYSRRMILVISTCSTSSLAMQSRFMEKLNHRGHFLNWYDTRNLGL